MTLHDSKNPTFYLMQPELRKQLHTPTIQRK